MYFSCAKTEDDGDGNDGSSHVIEYRLFSAATMKLRKTASLYAAAASVSHEPSSGAEVQIYITAFDKNKLSKTLKYNEEHPDSRMACTPCGKLGYCKL